MSISVCVQCVCVEVCEEENPPRMPRHSNAPPLGHVFPVFREYMLSQYFGKNALGLRGWPTDENREEVVEMEKMCVCVCVYVCVCLL